MRFIDKEANSGDGVSRTNRDKSQIRMWKGKGILSHAVGFYMKQIVVLIMSSIRKLCF